jgi:hypothetical protein
MMENGFVGGGVPTVSICLIISPFKIVQQGDALSPLLFNLALDYAIKKVLEIQVRLNLNGTHQLLTYADDVNILGDNIDNANNDT